MARLLLFLYKYLRVNRLILIFSVCLLFFTGCNKKEHGEQNAMNKLKSDSTKLVIAVLPTLDCIPLYVAAQQHIYDSLGISVKVVVYRSQMDAEESLIKGKSDICASDMFRTALLQSQKEPVRFLFTTNRGWQLIANKVLRISKVEQINDRMIGMTRNSVTDYLCDFVESHLKSNNQILRAQVNSVVVRMEMLENNQIETALLPQPMAFLAVMKGHTVLPFSTNLYKGLSGFAISSRLMKNRQYRDKLNVFLEGYNLAVDKLRKTEKLSLPTKTLQQFLLQDISDSISPRQAFSKATSPSTDKISIVLKWMKQRDAVRSNYCADTLFYKQ